jgi:hypothetical protein
MNFTQSGPATMIVTNSTISGNTSVSSGGGLLNRGYGSGAFGSEAQLTVLNCTISGNSAETGAGLLNGGYNAVGRLKIANSTVAENTGTYGRGIHNSGFAFVAIANCIFKSALPIGNAANLTTTVHNHGGIADSYGYNLTDDGGGGILTISTDQINTDPMLGPLQDNGGATWTHAPLGGSPAVDRGKNFGLDANNNPMPVDQRNHLRPVRYSGSIPMPQGGDGSDIGAVESPPGVLPTATRSRKAHGLPGEFDVDLPATGALGVESRSGGSNNEHRIVLTFAQPITLSGATVVEGTAQIGAMALNGDNTELTLTLAATNAQKIVLALQDVSDGTRTGDVGVRMGLLLGDSSGDGFVNSGDALQSRARSGLPSSNTTFRSDVNTDGFVNSGDTIIVRSRSGTSLP